jgi:hypothetical protein
MNALHLDKCISEARKTFTKMPEEVFQWLDKRIESLGWPPAGEKWNGVLRNRSIFEWRAMNWRKQSIHFDLKQFTCGTLEIIDCLLSANFLGENNQMSQMGVESRKRIDSILDYAREHGRLPPGMIFIKDGKNYEIVEGCHRLTVYAALTRHSQFIPEPVPLLNPTHECWIGYL